MKVNQLFRQGVEALDEIYSKNEAELIIKILLEHCLGDTTLQWIRDSERETDSSQAACFESGLKRLLNHEPIQHITGEAWFYKLPFHVNEHVLIPRPETEELVERTVKFATGKKGSLLDIGTGSGCIPITFLKNTTGWTATAIDLSAEALNVAEFNAKKNEVAVDFFQLNFLDAGEWSKLNKYEIIVSNPPYIPRSEEGMLSENVKAHEPHLALFVDDAMQFYSAIAQFGKKHLQDGGRIFLEVHQNYAQQTAALFRQENYTAEVIEDISGNERMVIASLNP